MKRLLVILLVLCPYVSYGTLFAQIYTTSSASYRSHSTSGCLATPPVMEFRTTSAYGRSMATTRTYSTAPMQMANGVVRTAASSLNGGTLLGGSSSINNESGTTTTPVIPGVPDTPLSTGWDVLLFLVALSIIYAIHKHRKSKVQNTEKSTSII